MRNIVFLILLTLSQIGTALAVVYGDGRQTVTTAGTAVELSATSTPVTSITLCAETDNTGMISVGSSPIAALATREGIPLEAGDCFTSDKPNNLTTILIDSTVNGDGVTFNWALA